MVTDKLAFVDTETVRIASDAGSAIWELAIILRGTLGDEEYAWQLRPDLTRADAAALRIGGYYERCKAADKPEGQGVLLTSPRGKGGSRMARLIALDVAKLLDGALIVGANPWFDAGHIDAFLRANDQALTADYHMRDVGSVVAGYMAGQRRVIRNHKFCKAIPEDVAEPGPLKGRKITDVAKELGLNPDRYETHTALGDCRLARDIWNAVFA